MIGEVQAAEEPSARPAIAELDRVLGGGLVLGGVVLLGSDTSIGESTLLLQALARLSEQLQHAVRERGGVGPAGGAARAPPQPAGAAFEGAGRDPAREDPGRADARAAGGRGGGLDPDHLFRGAAVRARQRRSGARVRSAAHALRRAPARRWCWSGTSRRKARSPGRGCSSTWWTVCFSSRATPTPASAWCARSRTASVRSTSWVCSP